MSSKRAQEHHTQRSSSQLTCGEGVWRMKCLCLPGDGFGAERDLPRIITGAVPEETCRWCAGDSNPLYD